MVEQIEGMEVDPCSHSKATSAGVGEDFEGQGLCSALTSPSRIKVRVIKQQRGQACSCRFNGPLYNAEGRMAWKPVATSGGKGAHKNLCWLHCYFCCNVTACVSHLVEKCH